MHGAPKNRPPIQTNMLLAASSLEMFAWFFLLSVCREACRSIFSYIHLVVGNAVSKITLYKKTLTYLSRLTATHFCLSFILFNHTCNVMWEKYVRNMYFWKNVKFFFKAGRFCSIKCYKVLNK